MSAALGTVTGQLIGTSIGRHRHEKLPAFLRLTDREVDKGKQIHAVLDNYATHIHDDVESWFKGTSGSTSTSPRRARRS